MSTTRPLTITITQEGDVVFIAAPDRVELTQRFSRDPNSLSSSELVYLQTIYAAISFCKKSRAQPVRCQ